MEIIPYGRQSVTEEDIEAVAQILRSDFWTQGPMVSVFEQAFAQYVDAQYAVAVANGTAALHLSVLALGLKPGEKVITSPITFAASANCVRYCGGEVVFADIEPETWLLDPKAVRKLLEAAPKGTYRGIIPVDFSGRPVPMEIFREIADEFGLWILEDACHAPGGYFTDREGRMQKCGNGKFADLAIFSFHPVKHIATGEGGMITTNNGNLYERLLRLRTHGITKDKRTFMNPVALAGGDTEYPGWYMEMQELGYNYRLTDLQAALGISQLKRADAGLQRRRELAMRYADAFDGKKGLLRQAGMVAGHAYHLYVLESENRFGLYSHLLTHRIHAQIHYIPIHFMPYYQQLGWKQGDFPRAESYYARCISLPMYPGLTDEQQLFVIECVLKFYAGA